ncbi:MAG: hypothetical protein GWP91_01820 [Rhodobacterales bacterium]|nr:hypothetical protein [Rhodobacterales bacterium]
MQQQWWLITAGFVGLGLAFILMPRPDTGESLEVDPTNVAPLDFDGNAVVNDPKHISMNRTKSADPSKLRVTRRDQIPIQKRMGANPVAAAQLKARSTPDAVYAGRVSGPLAGARRQLMLMEDEDAKAHGESLAQIILDLRALRRTPDEYEWAPIQAEVQAFLDAMNARPDWLEDSIINQVVVNVEKLLVEHEEAKNATPPE